MATPILTGVQEVKKVRSELTDFFNKVSKIYGSEETILELMSHRKYTDHRMFVFLKQLGLFKIDYLSELMLVLPDISKEQFRSWGLINEHDEFILGGRYVVPIKSVSGQVVALVGWHPKGGARKYVTTPTLGFSRDTSFFGLDCYQYSWDKWEGSVFLVEGIFDTISLRSIGLPAIGNQGLEMSPFKTQILSRFRRVIAIPDNDRAGSSVNPFTNKTSGKNAKFVWRIESDSVFVQLPEGVKDTDDFVREFDCYDDLVSCRNAKYLKKLKES